MLKRYLMTFCAPNQPGSIRIFVLAHCIRDARLFGFSRLMNMTLYVTPLAPYADFRLDKEELLWPVEGEETLWPAVTLDELETMRVNYREEDRHE